MCGITCIVSQASPKTNLGDVFNLFKKNIEKRGPDSLSTCLLTEKQFHLFFGASVLWLQGRTITKQPLQTSSSILLYNGDIFSGTDTHNNKDVLGDTTLFLDLLENRDRPINDAVRCFEGPYAFIYLDKKSSRLYFGRDVFGRRSLLLGKSDFGFVITSVASNNTSFNFMEVPAIGIFCLNINEETFELFPLHGYGVNKQKLNDIEVFLGRNVNIVNSFEMQLTNHFSEPHEDDMGIFKSMRGLPTAEAFNILLGNTEWLAKLQCFQAILENSVRTRVTTQPSYCQDCIKSRSECNHCLTGVLFSGGVDCAILALLVDKFTDKTRPIDLLNVAFDRCKDYKTPDRLTGLQTLEELKRLCPKRQWNFVEVNVTEEELNIERKNTISNLIYPLNTVLDDSLGCALWFAARGSSDTYRTPCRIVITGMGADELFGGYNRHRLVLRREGWSSLHSALEAEWQNIPYRNLGRDDRVVSDSERQLRLPYLDESVVMFARRLHCWEKTHPSDDLPQGIGEKIFLRSFGYYLGLRDAACLKKRALQFGSRIANPKENAHDVSQRLL